MMRLLARERMMPSSKDMTVAEGSRGFHGRRYSNNSTSTLDTYARCSLGSNQEILMGGPPSEHPLNSITGGRPQQNLIIPNTTCFQPSIGGRSVMSGDSYCTQESANEQMLHSSKKLKSDGVFSDSNGAIANTSMDTMNTHCLGNNMDIEMELDVRAKQSNGEHPSIRKPSEHKQMDDEGSVEQTKEGVTTISKSFLPNTKKAVSVASVAGWTEEQLAELFADY
uniref:Uncharacterized protein n=1 Tax=Arundo donax TaxID=35708 RepID=A0A0A9CTF5_ARUDO